MAFPGFYALAPCLATVVLIAVGSQGGSAVTSGLSMRPLVWVGQISYSLYLVHWPVLVFYRLARGVPIGVAEACALVVASVVVAWFSWRYVERPFREKRLLGSGNALFAGTGTAAGAILVMAMVVTFVPLRVPGDADRLASFLSYDDSGPYRRGRCFLFGHQDRLADFDMADCLQPAADKPNILLVGDSHGAHLWSGLNAAFPQANVMQATSTGCKPVLAGKGETTCVELVKMALETFLQSSRPDVIILSARWVESDFPDLERSLKTLEGKAGQVVVMGPIVEYAMPLPRLLAQVADGRNASLLVEARLPGPSETDRALAAMVRAAGADYASSYHLLCAGNSVPCTTITADGIPVQWDYGHLTEQGSRMLARELRDSGALRLGTDRAAAISDGGRE